MSLPPCGLYVTGVPLLGKEGAISAGLLLYFHNHSKQGPPLVLLPTVNTHNRWAFAERGYLVEGPNAAEFIAALSARPRQGFYSVVEPVQVTNAVLPKRTLVQVGYNKRGDAILFPAQPLDGNGFHFKNRGFRFEDTSVLNRLRECGFDPPGRAEKPKDEG